MLTCEKEDVMAATRGQWLLRNPALTRGLRRPCRERIDVALEQDETWSGTLRSPGVEIRCLSGMVWVTLEGDVEDRVLIAGDGFVTARPGRVAMMAFGRCRVQVAGCAEPRRAAGARPATSSAA